jgi:hypothetical protein
VRGADAELMPFPDVGHAIRSAMWSWYDTKLFVERSIAFSSDSLHVLTGVLVQLAAGLVLKRPISSWRPWLVVFVLACFNELVDLKFDYWPMRAMQYGESAKDLILTMVLPTVLLLMARRAPRLFAVTVRPRRK